jgi:hypothetical protein
MMTLTRIILARQEDERRSELLKLREIELDRKWTKEEEKVTKIPQL